MSSRAAIMVGALAAAALLATGCASDGAVPPKTGDAAAGGSAVDPAAGAAQGRESGADASSGGTGSARSGAGTPDGARSAEEIAAQVERDLAEHQRLMAARSGGNTAGAGVDGTAAGPGASTRGGVGATATPGAASGASSPGAGAAPNGAVIASEPPSTTPAPGSGTDGAGSIGASGDGTAARRVPQTPEALAGAAAALYRDASRADSPMRSLMALAALSIAEPDRPFNAEAISDITEEERRTLAAFHGFCRELGRQLASSDDPEAVAKSVEQLAREMRGERRLRLAHGEFCTSVEGFGNFARIEPREFIAHSAARFVLYFEVDGYRSTETGGEGWKTELSVELSILSERDGVPVWRRDWQTITDLAASQRKDFFVTHVVAVPEALSVGAYVMKIRVRDELAGALAELSLPFRMVAAPVVAPRPGSSASAPPSGAVPSGAPAPGATRP